VLCGSGSGKNHSDPGIPNESEEKPLKLINFDNFSPKLLNLKIEFLSIKKISIKSLYLVIICNLTHLLDGNTNVSVKNIRKTHAGSETGSGSEHGSETN
jgi:hypothetical protein